MRDLISKIIFGLLSVIILFQAHQVYADEELPIITIDFISGNIIDLVESPQLVRVNIEIQNYNPQHSYQVMEVTSESDGEIIKNPIHLLYVSDSGSDIFHFHPRNLIIAGKNSQCHIIESYNHTSDNKYLCNLVTELLVQENANVEHIKIQELSG